MPVLVNESGHFKEHFQIFISIYCNVWKEKRLFQDEVLNQHPMFLISFELSIYRKTIA